MLGICGTGSWKRSPGNFTPNPPVAGIPWRTGDVDAGLLAMVFPRKTRLATPAAAVRGNRKRFTKGAYSPKQE